jgi:hypothetical protein
MTLVTRQGKGSKLTIQEMDGNLEYLESSNKPIDITYQELYNKTVGGELLAGSWYRLTDYKSVNFLNGWEIANNNPTPTDPNFNPQEIYEGESEVLILKAKTPYEISEIGYSETFSGDIVQYLPYVNKIGVDIEIFNGNILPNDSEVSGFNLQWDGTNVYFNMPEGYPALFGHYFYIYCEFDGGSYYQDGCFEPLTPNISICQYPFTSDDPDNGYLKAMSRIKVVDNGSKIVLLDLTEEDYNNYDADSLYVDTVYELGNAYGWITRRQDTHRLLDIPFDFRARKYRRFEVDLSSINSSLGIGYFGQGDNYLNQGTTGNYKDFFSINWKESDSYAIEWKSLGGPDRYWVWGYNDNVVFLRGLFGSKFGESFVNNTIGDNFLFNTISNNFGNNTIGDNFNNNTIGNNFNNNTIGNNFGYNTIGNSFGSNIIGNNFGSNIIGNFFSNNTISNFFGLNSIKVSLSSANFTSATHVYGEYNCEIFRRSDNTLQLSYIDGNNTIQYTAITA